MKVTTIYYQYRDGGNYKTGQEVSFPNPKGLTEEQIAERLEKIGINMHDNILLSDFDLQSYGFQTISPIENQYDPNPTEYDHPYHEIVAIDCADSRSHNARPTEEHASFQTHNGISIHMFLDDLESIRKSLPDRRIRAIDEAMYNAEQHLEYLRAERKWYEENRENITKQMMRDNP